MKVQAVGSSTLKAVLLFGSMALFGLTWSSTSSAAQGCGYGYHMNPWGRCLPNAPGPYATFIPGRPNCWRNRWGAVRCY
ncbi:GCG_CRPN prefix-to-repeats domain-containing protein [Legionella sp. CNM-4043-24]|uniref:GCG_CRPN prefix-to-repeats domain-containing protein n=1 Tax=Legionella sp. CNM-4043-24 TaxID=3421646 RepID=UPI00403A8998